MVLTAMSRLAKAMFLRLLVIAVSFLPVLTLQGEAGRLFRRSSMRRAP